MVDQNVIRAKGLLQDAIARQNLSTNAQIILERLAMDPHGILRNSASAIVVPMIASSVAEADVALLELYGKQLIIEHQTNGEPRINANYDKLGITAEDKAILTNPEIPFEIIGQPHSPAGMMSLRQFFEDPEVIYVPLSVTAHDVFDKLDERSKAGKETVFFLPTKKNLAPRLKTHYSEILNGWVKFLKNGPSYLRENVHLRIVNLQYWDIYTSAISSSSARLTFYQSSFSSTRDGTIVHVDKESSLYAMLKGRIEEIYKDSRPIFRLSPGLWSLHILKRAAWPISLAMIGIICTRFTNPFAGMISAIAIGLLRTWIIDVFQVKKWNHYELYRK